MFSPTSESSSLETRPSEVQPQPQPVGLSVLPLTWQVIQRYIPGLPGDDHQFIENRVEYHLSQLHKAVPSLEDVKGKRILALACGSRAYTDDTIGRYEPWMCRLLLHLGATPVGIDLAGQLNESFTSYKVDLTVPDALGFLDDGSFDAVYVCAFPTRKAVSHLDNLGLTWPSVRDNILTHMRRCLKPGGIIIRQFGPEDDKLAREALGSDTPPLSPHRLTLPPHNLPRHYFDDDEYLL